MRAIPKPSPHAHQEQERRDQHDGWQPPVNGDVECVPAKSFCLTQASLLWRVAWGDEGRESVAAVTHVCDGNHRLRVDTIQKSDAAPSLTM